MERTGRQVERGKDVDAECSVSCATVTPRASWQEHEHAQCQLPPLMGHT